MARDVFLHRRNCLRLSVSQECFVQCYGKCIILMITPISHSKAVVSTYVNIRKPAHYAGGGGGASGAWCETNLPIIRRIRFMPFPVSAVKSAKFTETPASC
jgi:hypothetical protein